MVGFEKLIVLKEVLDGIISILVNNKVLPDGPVPQDKTLIDWVLDHIRGLELSEDTVERMEEEYWRILQENKEFLYIAQSFFADAAYIVRQPNAEPLLREAAENLIVLINTTWGLVTFFPLLMRYLKQKEERFEEALKTFASALITNVTSILSLDQVVRKAREKVTTSLSLEGTELN